MYVGIGPNKNLRVQDSDALSFVMAECGYIRPSFVIKTATMEEADRELVNWFFSGDWIHEDETQSA